MDNILVTINNKEELYNKFNCHKVNQELADYLYNQSFCFAKNKKIKIVMQHTFDLNDLEKEQLIDMIRNHFGLEVKKRLFFDKYKNIKCLLLFIIGVITIFLSNIALLKETVFAEVLLIAGWVCIWEVVYRFLFEDMKENIQIKRCRNLTNDIITFQKI